MYFPLAFRLSKKHVCSFKKKMSYQYLSYLSLTIKMSHNPGDKSVTMCGIAQEWEENTKTFTRPWHVTVETINQVSLSLRSVTKIIMEILYFKLDFHTIKLFFLIDKASVCWIHCEPELGADSCSLLRQGEHRRPSEGAHWLRSVSSKEHLLKIKEKHRVCSNCQKKRHSIALPKYWK